MEVTYDALKKRVAKLEAENAGLSANQCLHNIHGDEAGNPYCPRIAELEKMQGTLLTMFRINMIRMNPNLSHEHIDDVLFRIIDQTVDFEFTERNTGDYHEGLEEGIKIGKAEAAARIVELKAALDFYACIDHYQTHNAIAPNVVQTDRGAKARAALEGGKDE